MKEVKDDDIFSLFFFSSIFLEVTFPAMHTLLSKWAPPLERSRLSTLCYGGCYIGTVLAFPISSIIAASPKLGWPFIFYIFGGISVIWFFFWCFLVFESPSVHPFISQYERGYIESTLPPVKKLTIPWKKILTNSAVWALIINNGCINWVSSNILLQNFETESKKF